MVDYVAKLARAVAALNPNTRERRRVLYDHFRKVMVEQLRSRDLTLSHTDLRAESAALEAAIRRVEADATDVAYVEQYQDRPPLKDLHRRSRTIPLGVATLIILCAGVATYSFWQRLVPSERHSSSQPTANKAVLAVNRGYVYQRQLVYYRTNYPVGTIVVDESQNFIYVVRPNVSAERYSIGVGPGCIALAGRYHVVRKEEWPGWAALAQQRPDVARDRMNNPLGARAVYLNDEHSIHGTNAPTTIGQRVPDGCIRLANDDVIYLYDRTPLNSSVVVLAE